MADPLLPGWNSRRKLTLKGSELAADVAGFPLIIPYDAATYPFTWVQADGADLRFTQSDGTTLLPYGLEVFNPTGTNSWRVKTDITAGDDSQYVYLYYGKPGATSAANWASVWDAHHQACYRMDEASGSILDSTGRGETLVVTGSPTYGEPGQVGSVVKWPNDGNPSHALGADIDGINGVSELTWEFWHKASARTTAEYAVQQIDASDERINFYILTDGRIFLHFRNGANTEMRYSAGTAGTANQWHHYAVVYDGSSPSLQLYVDGSLRSGGLINGPIPATAPDCSGGAFRVSSNWSCAQDVWIDDLRISSVARSTSWLDAGRLGAAGTMIQSIGAEETAPSRGRATYTDVTPAVTYRDVTPKVTYTDVTARTIYRAK